MAKMQFVNFKVRSKEHLKIIEDRIQYPTYMGNSKESTNGFYVVTLSEKTFNIIKAEVLDKQKIPFKVITPKRIRLECETEENKTRWEELDNKDLETEEKKTLSDRVSPIAMGFYVYHENNVKQALDEFFDWIIINFSKKLDDDIRIRKKEKEIFGDRLS